LDFGIADASVCPPGHGNSIIEALDAGQSVADSLAPVERFLADTTNRLRAGHFMEKKPGDLWAH
jgi:hypothetical protein